MKNMLLGPTLLLCLIMIFGIPSASRGTDMEGNAEILWGEREDLGKAAEGIAAFEELLTQRPEDYEILLRLSRLHYWVGQNLEGKSKGDALSHYNKGREYGGIFSRRQTSPGRTISRGRFPTCGG
jgi:hypothetical protein